MPVGKSRKNFLESVLSFHNAGPRFETQVIRFGSNLLYPSVPPHWPHSRPYTRDLKTLFESYPESILK